MRYATKLERSSDWREQALCAETAYRPKRGNDPWFSHEPVDKNYALEICKQCPVRQQCFDAGVNETTGIWGGIDKKPSALQTRQTQIEKELDKILAGIDAGVPAETIAQELGISGEAIRKRARRQGLEHVAEYFRALYNKENRERKARRAAA